jgi:pimeloyl-ACP methyl ester carboxylesterase
VLVPDGEAIFGTVVQAAAALARAGHVPEAVVVGIENTDRLRDLSPPGIPVSGNDGRGRGDLFLRFLASELVPALETELRGGGPAVIVGHSSGGLFAHYALSLAPDVIPAAVALDAPMHLGDGAAADLLADARAPRTRAVTLVSLESRFGWQEAEWERLMERAPEGWMLERATLEGEDHGSVVWPGSYRGLKAVFADYSTVASSRVTPAERLRRFDGGPFGEVPSTPPPAELLARAATDLIGARVLEEAARTIERLSSAYGDMEVVRDLRARLEVARSEPLEGPTLEEMRAAPPPEAETLAPLLGRWEGYLRREGASGTTPLTLTLRMEEGRPVGSISVGSTPPRAIEYVAADGSSFAVGYMNGMRPRGMLVYEGAVEGDIFEGDFVLRGVVYRLPDGRQLPRTLFRLERDAR